MLKMPNINQLAISGVIEGQPVRRDGFVELTVACRRNFRDKDGEWVEETSYVTAHVKSKPIESRAGIGDATLPGPLAEGLPVFITGRIRSAPPTHDRLYMEARHVEVLNKHRQHDEQEPCPTTATTPC